RFMDRRVPDARRPHPAHFRVVSALHTTRTLPLPYTWHRSYGRGGSDRHRTWQYLGAPDRPARLSPHRPRRRDRTGSGAYTLERFSQLGARCRGFDRHPARPKELQHGRAYSPTVTGETGKAQVSAVALTKAPTKEMVDKVPSRI